jgi:hypothetical protein
VQVELATTPSGCAVVLKRDCTGSCAEWCLHCRLVRRERELVGVQPGSLNAGPCRRCAWHAPIPHGGFSWEFRRGFVEAVSCSCAAWLGHGPALVRAQPLTEVHIFNVALYGPVEHGLQRDRYFWLRRDLPAGVWALLPEEDGNGATAGFTSPGQGRAALSRACILWAWREAWKCPECGGCGHIARPPRWASAPVPCGACHGTGVLRAAPASLTCAGA